jgi:tRNA/rRNA methyltransferase/tRNA (cytidine32/uridine32-2'-O)-methyltransferase
MLLPHVRIVLVGTSHPGNIGAAARAMKNMGLTSLHLADPQAPFPSPEASARASGADDVLERASVHRGLGEALAGCGYALGLSARLRSLPWPVVEPREAAVRALQKAQAAPVALVFGREKSGLSNDELARCQALVHIPANPDYSSLNLAMAVQIMTYELRLASRESLPESTAREDFPPATLEDMEHFYNHLESAMVGAGFLNPDNPRHLMRRLRRLYNRAQPDQNELSILRGILSALAPDAWPPRGRESGGPAR